MSGKTKYLGITAFFTAAAVCAFLAAYSVFNATPKIKIGDNAYENVPQDLAELPYEQELTDAETGGPETEESLAASVIADKINEDTIIVYEYYYVDENRTERAEQKASYALLDLTREQLLSRIEGFSVLSFSPKEVVLRKKIVSNKSDRYILGIWDGHVAVFHGGSGVSQNGLKEVTDTPVSSLSQDEQERLSDGISIEGNEALMKVLEDYGS